MTRSEIIECLCDIKTDAVYQLLSEEKEAIDYAISSLRTDEAYQLEYEGREVKEVVHAKWLMPDKNYSNKIWRKCSNCGTHIEKYSKYISFVGETNYFEHILNYCPICGAKMDLRGGKDGTMGTDSSAMQHSSD